MVRLKTRSSRLGKETWIIILSCLMVLISGCAGWRQTEPVQGRWLQYDGPPPITSASIVAKTSDELCRTLNLHDINEISPELAKQLLERGYPYLVKQYWDEKAKTVMSDNGYRFLPANCGKTLQKELGAKFSTDGTPVIVWTVVEKDDLYWIHIVEAKSVITYKYNEYCVTELWPAEWYLTYDARRGLATLDVKSFPLRLDACWQKHHRSH